MNIHIIGGGTVSHVRSHMALAAVAYGGTARKMAHLIGSHDPDVRTTVHLTRMANGGQGKLETNADVARLVDTLIADPATNVIVMSAALCDFTGTIGLVSSGKYADRLATRDTSRPVLQLTPAEKIIGRIRKERKDIFVVGFKTTTNKSEQEQYIAGLTLLKGASLNLVLANDVVTRLNMVITPEESRYSVTTDRVKALGQLTNMMLMRAGGTFTRSEVVGTEADMVPWSDERVPANLREVVDWCIAQGAYKPFNGKTAGHFAVKLCDNEFLTSPRKRNFNDLDKIGLVRVEALDDNRVIAHGAKPSVGGQSQRIIFAEHSDADCIVHFHCPLRPSGLGIFGDNIPVRPQWPYECGSHECGQNTSHGLRDMDGGIKAVMLDNHGPNIVFSRQASAADVIDFIRDNFDLSQKTGGPVELP